MKKKIVPVLLTTAVFSSLLIFESSTNGPQAASAGSPIENGLTCTQCHGGVANSGAGSMTIEGVSDYVAGQDYTITIKVKDESSSKFGFQAVAVDENDNAVGSFAAGTGTRIYTNRGIGYIEQSKASKDGVFTFNWTAPTSDVGDITFYAAGNASNGNGKEGGDHIYTSQLSVTSSPMTIEDEPLNELNIYPNPTISSFRIDFGNIPVIESNIYGLSGELVYTNKSSESILDIDTLPTGVYLLKAVTEEGLIIKKIVVG